MDDLIAGVQMAAHAKVRCVPNGTVILLLLDEDQTPIAAIRFTAENAVKASEGIGAEALKALAILQSNTGAVGHG